MLNGFWAYIARGHAAAVWRFLGRRILDDQRGRDHGGRYEAIPYQFYRLPEVLSQDAASAVRVTRGLYTPDDTLFQFRGARLLSAMFPTFPENLAHELTALAATGTDDDLGFIFQVLQRIRARRRRTTWSRSWLRDCQRMTSAWGSPKFAFKAQAWSEENSDSSTRIEREKDKSRHG
jgi:hypothetical protein